MIKMTLEEFIDSCKSQASCREEIVVVCPMCKCAQTAKDLINAGAGKNFDEVEKYFAFSCVGRWLGAKSPRNKPDGKLCNWTLGGFLQLHEFEVVTPDGKSHPRFRLATLEEAQNYRK